MSVKKLVQSTFLVIWATLILLSTTAVASSESYYLDNGMEVILKESPGSPMISSMMLVKSGAKYESEFENGITHFLEHLLFDGTTNHSRKELDLSISDLGGYVNAFTRKEFTAFFVLLPSQYIEYGMAIQADMLFNSNFPEDELQKERKIVIEEIKGSDDRPGSATEAFFTEKAYGQTDYGRPILGYESFIESIPREAIIDYWKRYYKPSNMTLLVIGDFASDPMKQIIAKVFEAIPDLSSDADSVAIPPTEQILSGQHRYDTVANVTSTHLNFSFAAPSHTQPDYLPMDLVAGYLGDEEVSPLIGALKNGENPLATEVSVYLDTKSDFSRFEISVLTDQAENADTIIATILRSLSDMPNVVADSEFVTGLKTSVKCNDIYNTEKLHYYGFMVAPQIVATGWDAIQSYALRLEAVSWSNCREAAGRWLVEPNYVVTVVRPISDSSQVAYQPQRLTANQVTSHFDTITTATHDLSASWPLEFPATDSIDFELVDDAAYSREVLPNGLTVIVKTSPGNQVFAMSVIGKGRTVNEPAGKAGITDFVNRCLEKGTINKDAAELSHDLTEIGALTTLYDNPWIPYDDKYTTRRFSFMKFQTIDKFAHKGFLLFSEMLLEPRFDSADVESVRRQMLGVLGRQSGSPRNVARDLFHATLFGDGAYANPIMGSMRTIGSISASDLTEHHGRFYSPQNMILTIVSSRAVGEVMNWVNQRYGQVDSTSIEAAIPSPPIPISEIRSAHKDLDKEQISIYLGGKLPGATSDEAIALSIANNILSTRLYLDLREKQGLAYSVGAGAKFDRDFGWHYCVMTTGAENYQRAVEGLKLHMDKLRLDGPTEDEISRARNYIWGRLMAAKLSRVNQAYYLGVDEYFGRELKHDQTYLKQLSQVTPDSIRRVTSKYFLTDRYVIATAGKLLP